MWVREEMKRKRKKNERGKEMKWYWYDQREEREERDQSLCPSFVSNYTHPQHNTLLGIFLTSLFSLFPLSFQSLSRYFFLFSFLPHIIILTKIQTKKWMASSKHSWMEDNIWRREIHVVHFYSHPLQFSAMLSWGWSFFLFLFFLFLFLFPSYL